MTMPTTDLCDAHEDRLATGALRVLTPGWLMLGGRRAFDGPAVTLKVFEDNALVRTALENPGQGAVLVIDGGGSVRCALVGGNLAQMAERNGWAGILVNGAVRDTVELKAAHVGVCALAVHPVRSIKRGVGECGVAVQFPGAVIRPGNWIYVDDDGILVSDERLT